MSACIQLEHLSKRYGRTLALDGVSLEARAGEVFGLLGPNGAGKTTLLHVATGLTRPSGGRARVFGVDVRRRFAEVAPRVGVCFEHPAFYGHLTARDNLALLARLAGRHADLDAALAQAGLADVAGRKVRACSAGMRQRLALAQAMLGPPDLLLLDEPTANLDVEGAMDVLARVRRLADEHGVAVLIASHQLHEVERICGRVAVLDRGKLVACEQVGTALSYDLTEIEVLLDDPAGAVPLLTALDWVASAEMHPGAVRVRLHEDRAHELTAFLVQTGHRVSGVIPRRRTLEDYFLAALNKR